MSSSGEQGSRGSVAAEGPQARIAWDFDRVADRLGWSVPDELLGSVFGGCMWLAFSPREHDPAKIASWNYQVFGDYDVIRRISAGEELKTDGPSVNGELSQAGPASIDIVSPDGLALTAPADPQRLLVRLRVINRSPVTDVLVRWKPAGPGGTEWRVRRVGLEPDSNDWQDLVGVIEADPGTLVDQIALGFSENVIRGDLWIDSVHVVEGEPPPPAPRPVLVGDDVVPRVTIPGIPHEVFADAFAVMDEILVTDVPAHGMPAVFQRAGGHPAYGDVPWPVVDAPLSAAASAWADQEFAENVIRGLAVLQSRNPDGRVSGYSWEAVPGQPSDAGMRPDMFFVNVRNIAVRSADPSFRDLALRAMERYLGWYLSSVKRDPRTGLITGDYEEAVGSDSVTWIDFDPLIQRLAPIALTTTVVVAAYATADLARTMGRIDAAEAHETSARALAAAINAHQWVEEGGRYVDVDVTTRAPFVIRPGSTGLPQAAEFFGLGTSVPPEREGPLLARLTSPDFNWGGNGIPNLTLAAETPEWIWALTNVPVILALERAGHDALAAEANWSFLRSLATGYSEGYRLTSEHVEISRFGFSAAWMIEGVLGHLFGIRFDGVAERITVQPRIPAALAGVPLRVEGVLVPFSAGTRMSVDIAVDGGVLVEFSGLVPRGTIEVGVLGRESHVGTTAATQRDRP